MTRTYACRTFATLLVTAAALLAVPVREVAAASATDLNRDARAELRRLYRTTPSAKVLGEKAKAILVFPSIVKGGFIVGGAYGEGVLYKGAETAGYYNSVAASWGLQAGVQSFGYVLFLMTDEAVAYLAKSEGWEIGVGPSIVIVDKGMANSLTTTTGKSDIYAFIFNQKGLMAGIGLQGSKITKIEK